MSNSNFTPETLPSFPSVSSPPVSPLKGGKRVKGQTGSDWETGGPTSLVNTSTECAVTHTHSGNKSEKAWH